MKEDCFKGCFCSKAGFTLIELLVVVLIIGILAAVAVPQYKITVVKSRVATMLSLVASLASAQEVYYLAHGSYATDVEDLDVEIPGECNSNTDYSYQFACGKYFLLSVIGSSPSHIDVYYCPDNNTSWESCQDNREIGIYQYLKHSPGAPDKKICYSHNSSKLGKAVCSNLSAYEVRED